MDLKQTGLGVVLFVVFWAFQIGLMNPLGTTAWVVGVVIFSILLWLIGKVSMPGRSPAGLAELWKYTTVFAIVATAFIAYAGPFVGAVFRPGFTPAVLMPLVLSFWLIVFGAAMFLTGWSAKWEVTAAVGVLWVIASTHFISNISAGPNSYLHFGLLVGFPFIIYGLITKR